MTDMGTSGPIVESAPLPAPAPATISPAPALITERQVLFATAAAVARPAKTRRWIDVFVSFASAVCRAAGPPEPVPHHHSERYAYLHDALMAREMDRL